MGWLRRSMHGLGKGLSELGDDYVKSNLAAGREAANDARDSKRAVAIERMRQQFQSRQTEAAAQERQKDRDARAKENDLNRKAKQDKIVWKKVKVAEVDKEGNLILDAWQQPVVTEIQKQYRFDSELGRYVDVEPDDPVKEPVETAAPGSEQVLPDAMQQVPAAPMPAYPNVPIPHGRNRY